MALDHHRLKRKATHLGRTRELVALVILLALVLLALAVLGRGAHHRLHRTTNDSLKIRAAESDALIRVLVRTILVGALLVLARTVAALLLGLARTLLGELAVERVELLEGQVVATLADALQQQITGINRHRHDLLDTTIADGVPDDLAGDLLESRQLTVQIRNLRSRESETIRQELEEVLLPKLLTNEVEQRHQVVVVVCHSVAKLAVGGGKRAIIFRAKAESLAVLVEDGLGVVLHVIFHFLNPF